jgi:hypothetical protein
MVLPEGPEIASEWGDELGIVEYKGSLEEPSVVRRILGLQTAVSDAKSLHEELTYCCRVTTEAGMPARVEVDRPEQS